MVAEFQFVLDYWFGELDGEITVGDKQAQWFLGGDGVDSHITEHFQQWVSRAGRGELNYWGETAQGRLALIILLDQFPRNIYRGLNAAYRYDSLALALCKRGLALNQDCELTAIEQAFFFLPLEHSEDLEDQEESIFRFDSLRNLVSEKNKIIFDSFYDFANIHYQVIAKFGRFPHRNAVKGRLSTIEEIAWLSDGGLRFGQ